MNAPKRPAQIREIMADGLPRSAGEISMRLGVQADSWLQIRRRAEVDLVVCAWVPTGRGRLAPVYVARSAEHATDQSMPANAAHHRASLILALNRARLVGEPLDDTLERVALWQRSTAARSAKYFAPRDLETLNADALSPIPRAGAECVLLGERRAGVSPVTADYKTPTGDPWADMIRSFT